MPSWANTSRHGQSESMVQSVNTMSIRISTHPMNPATLPRCAGRYFILAHQANRRRTVTYLPSMARTSPDVVPRLTCGGDVESGTIILGGSSGGCLITFSDLL